MDDSNISFYLSETYRQEIDHTFNWLCETIQVPTHNVQFDLGDPALQPDINQQPETIQMLRGDAMKTWLKCGDWDSLERVFFAEPSVQYYFVAPTTIPTDLGMQEIEEVIAAARPVRNQLCQLGVSEVVKQMVFSMMLVTACRIENRPQAEVTVRRLIAYGIDINAPSINAVRQVGENFLTALNALVAAVYLGKFWLVELLVEFGANVNEFGSLAMYICANYNGSGYICDYLIDNGINPLKLEPHPLASRARGSRIGHSPLLTACTKGRYEVVVRLYHRVNLPSDHECGELLYAAVQSRKYDQVKYLLECGENPSILLPNRPPLLIQAAAVNDTETLLLFLQYNIDMTVTHGNNGNNVVFTLASLYAGNVNMINYLLSLHPELGNVNEVGETLLMVAITSGNIPLIHNILEQEASQSLVEATSFINLRDNAKRSALMIACRCGNTEVVRMILECASRHGWEINLDFQDDDGYTALMFGVDHMDIVVRLLSADANPSIRNKQGFFALDLTPDDEIRAILRAAQRNRAKRSLINS